jgi:hypothetical protein
LTRSRCIAIKDACQANQGHSCWLPKFRTPEERQPTGNPSQKAVGTIVSLTEGLDPPEPLDIMDPLDISHQNEIN